MKILSSPRTIAALACALVATAFTSCQSYTVRQASRQVDNARYTDVQGFNGAMAPASRQYANYGPVPAKVRDAMSEYIRYGEWKTVEYARPQYYLIFDNACWAICADPQGRMTGIMAFRGAGKNGIAPKSDARVRQATGKHKLIVNTSDDADRLSYEIMKGLEPADAYRKSVRKALGLEAPVVVTPMPRSTRPSTRTSGSAATTPVTPAADTTPVVEADETDTVVQDADTGVDTGVDIEAPADDDTTPVIEPAVNEVEGGTADPAGDPLEIE